ncbi:MAG TPA: hypothetical protein VMX74_12050 [Pirellulales bacterium]|nr:hypothetical protein [Pirellulales bacterium]
MAPAQRTANASDGASHEKAASKSETPTASSRYIIPPPLKDLGRAYKVRLVYFVPNDKNVKDEYQEKIEVLMRVVADIYRREFKSNGQRTRGLDFEFDNDGKLQVHLVNGDQPSVFYTGNPYSVDRLLDSTTQEVTVKLGAPDKRACLIFSEAGGIAEARPQYPHCGFAMVSADMLRDDVTGTTIEQQIDNFFDPTPARKVDGKEEEPRSKASQVTNGVLIHELGHIFFMLHDTREVNRNIMAYGYHNLGKMFDPKTARKRPVCFSLEHARIAAASRFLSESFDESDEELPALEFRLASQPKAGDTMVEFHLKMADSQGLKAMICMQRGGGSYDGLVGGLPLKGKSYEKTVKFTTPRPLVENQPLVYIINVIDENGNCSQAMQRSSVAPK